MWNIGHRGASGHYPENTLLAFRKAIEMGANALEFDVHLCQSGEPVVIHDETLERTTSGRGRVDAHTLSDLIKLNAGLGERIPTLEEILTEFAARFVLFIEIKSSAAAVPVGKLIAQSAARGVPHANMPVIGFHGEWLLAAKAVDEKILVGFSPDNEAPIPSSYCAEAKRAGAWSVNPCIDQLDEAFMEKARAQNLKVITWTANTPVAIARAQALEVDGIISDYPDRL